MLEYLSQEIRDGLVLARQRRARRSRLRVQIGERTLALHSLGPDQLVFEAVPGTRLRGFVDVFDGGRHLMHGLIVASRFEGDLLICEFKQMNTVRETPPLDYGRDDEGPAGLLPSH